MSTLPTRTGRPTVAREIARAAEQAAAGHRVLLQTDLAPGLDADDQERRALVCIARAAVLNAVRHGGAHRVTVELTGPGPIVLRITDDGEALRGGGIGALRRRAEAVGGTLSLAIEPGRGISLTTSIP